MKTRTHSFKKGRATGFDRLFIDTIIYEKHDDGFALECEVERGGRILAKTISIDFHEWNNILGKIEDPFLRTRLQDVISERVLNSEDWITAISLPEIFGTTLEIEEYDFENQYMELRA